MAKITHIMADGTTRKSMKGVVIDPKQCPGYYEFLISFSKRNWRDKSNEQTNE